MNVAERLLKLNQMFNDLEWTTSKNEKEAIVKQYSQLDQQLSLDIAYAFEILTGMHKLGYTFIMADYRSDSRHLQDISLEEYLTPLYSLENKAEYNIRFVCSRYAAMYKFLAPLLNRTWRVGINKSQVKKTCITPMLAKKYEPGKHCVKANETYYITEKLDGNRCIAYFDSFKHKWIFYSRSGKELKVDFDMNEMPTTLIYDGEILSKQQIENPGQHNFNSLSGAINSKYGNKNDLVYEIFDIVDDVTPYSDRRATLTIISYERDEETSNTKILPLIAKLNKDTICQLDTLLEQIENKGGEGLMINVGSRKYEHKRTDSLLKVKSTYTMDMRVVGLEAGTGKNEGLVGALVCELAVSDPENNRFKVFSCKVGSGLSDQDRRAWAYHPDDIIGAIVEVAYFSVSQNKNDLGTNYYSLRFPRFKRVRTDKDSTSAY